MKVILMNTYDERHERSEKEPIAAAEKLQATARPSREFVLMIGDEAEVTSDCPSGLVCVRAYETVDQLLTDLRQWVDDCIEDAAEADQPKIMELLAARDIGDAATLFARSSGRWWHCYHPDLGESLGDMLRT